MSEQVLVFKGVAWRATHYQGLFEAAGIQVQSISVPNELFHELHMEKSGLLEALRIVHGDALRVAEGRDEGEMRA